MEETKDLKKIVRDKYAEIANQSTRENQASCCGAGGCSTEVYNIMTDDYSQVEGYQKEADLGLGCGLPTQFAKIKPGDTVIDLGSGAGNDCFIARRETGEQGKVIGIDFTEAMISKARQNVDKLGFNNVEFRYGDIDDMPVADNTSDVIVSNCVLNLVPDKQKVISEIFRTLKPGGHFSISDIVLEGELPKALREDAEMYAGCVSGAIQKGDYLNFIRETGFDQITVQKEKPITIPDDILSKYLSAEEIESFGTSGSGIFSITVFGQKPGGEKTEVPVEENNTECTPGGGCC